MFAKSVNKIRSSCAFHFKRWRKDQLAHFRSNWMSLKTTNRTGKKRSRLGKWSVPSYTARKGQNGAWTQDPRSLSQFQLLGTMLGLMGDREEALRLVLVLYSETKNHTVHPLLFLGWTLGGSNVNPSTADGWKNLTERNQGHAKDLGLSAFWVCTGQRADGWVGFSGHSESHPSSLPRFRTDWEVDPRIHQLETDSHHP